MGTGRIGIIGAGFAGLACALTLRRHRVAVTVFDGGPARNAWTHEVHGYLGISGMSGRELRRQGLAQVRAVGAEIVEREVTEARRERNGFVLHDSAGMDWNVQGLVLATGVTDAFPDIAGLPEFLGTSVFTCPHCDGYEFRDQPVAVVTWAEWGAHFIETLRDWTRDITVVTDGRSLQIPAEQVAALAEQGVRVREATVARLEGQDGRLHGLRLVSGELIPARGVFFNINTTFQNGLARRLGCRVRDDGPVEVDGHGRTSVPNVWAVGDLTGEEQLVPVATAQGVRAAIDIYRSPLGRTAPPAIELEPAAGS